jgi:hypothetical protein
VTGNPSFLAEKQMIIRHWCFRYKINAVVFVTVERAFLVSHYVIKVKEFVTVM